MQKCLKIITAISIFFLFTACSGNKPIEGQMRYEHYHEVISTVFECRHYYDYYGYKAYPFSTAKNTPGFVSYEMIEDLGSFQTATITIYTDNESTSHYSYELIDSNGCKYELFITENPEDFSNAPKPQFSDLRKNNPNTSDSYNVNGIHYYYGIVNLDSIAWNSDTHNYHLFIRDELYDYDMESGTFLSKILNIDTAEQAVADFNKKIESQLTWNRLLAIVGTPVQIVFVIFVATAAFLIIHKICLRKRENISAD